jgi:hypothetical protein
MMEFFTEWITMEPVCLRCRNDFYMMRISEGFAEVSCGCRIVVLSKDYIWLLDHLTTGVEKTALVNSCVVIIIDKLTRSMDKEATMRKIEDCVHNAPEGRDKMINWLKIVSKLDKLYKEGA